MIWGKTIDVTTAHFLFERIHVSETMMVSKQSIWIIFWKWKQFGLVQEPTCSKNNEELNKIKLKSGNVSQSSLHSAGTVPSLWF